jgi:serine/threonine-protein kinase
MNSKSAPLLAFAVLSLAAFAAQGAQAYDRYGAIAYSPETGSHAWSYDFPSRATAENDALLRCQTYGAGCVVAVWFRNACGALAVSSENNGYGTGWAGGQRTAERIALNYCEASSGSCQVARWVCTSR